MILSHAVTYCYSNAFSITASEQPEVTIQAMRSETLRKVSDEIAQTLQDISRDHPQRDVAVCPFSGNTDEASRGLPMLLAAWANDNLCNARLNSNALSLVFYTFPSDKTKFIRKRIICGMLSCVFQDGKPIT